MMFGGRSSEEIGHSLMPSSMLPAKDGRWRHCEDATTTKEGLFLKRLDQARACRAASRGGTS